MTPVTPEGRGLEAVLAAHAYTLQLGRGAVCICGHVPDVDPSTLQTQQDYHRAHVAAAVREWLTSEAVVEAAAEGAHREACGCAIPVAEHAFDYSRDIRAALTAATEADAPREDQP